MVDICLRPFCLSTFLSCFISRVSPLRNRVTSTLIVTAELSIPNTLANSRLMIPRSVLPLSSLFSAPLFSGPCCCCTTPADPTHSSSRLHSAASSTLVISHPFRCPSVLPYPISYLFQGTRRFPVAVPRLLDRSLPGSAHQVPRLTSRRLIADNQLATGLPGGKLLRSRQRDNMIVNAMIPDQHFVN